MTLEELARKAAGFTGSAIDKLTDPFNWSPNTSFGGNNLIDLSATLQNWGGNAAGSGWGIVKPVSAAENNNDDSSSIKIYNWEPDDNGTDDTGSKTGNTGNGGSGDNNSDKEKEANDEYNRVKTAILSRLQMMKDEANRLRTSAKGTYDFTTGQIAKNYQKLKDLSAEKLTQALEGLTQADTSVQNTYGRLSGNALRAMESAVTRNRMLHRALGSLGSSFYADSQTDTTNEGMNSINDIKTEEAGKRAAIDTQTASAKTDFAQNDVAIQAEEAQLNQDALDTYNEAISNADLLEKNYNIDSTEAIAEADSKLDSALSAIKTYISDKTIANQAASASTGSLANFSNNYNATGNIKNTLDNNENYDAAKEYIANASKVGTSDGYTFPTSTNDNSYLSLLKSRLSKKDDEDKTGYYVNTVA